MLLHVIILLCFIYNVQWLDTAKPVASMRGDEVPELKGMANIANWIANNWVERGKSIISRRDVGDIQIDRKSVKTSAGHGLSRNKVRAFYLIPEVLEKGRFLGTLPHQQGKPSAEIIAAPIKIGDEHFKMYLEVRKDANMHKMYVHEVVLRNENSTAPTFIISAASHEGAEPQSEKRGALFNFIQNLRNVNASKVVDENGEPLVVYHGTGADFSEFDLSVKSINGGYYGKGIYATSNKESASGYAEDVDSGSVMPLFMTFPHTRGWAVNELCRVSTRRKYCQTSVSPELTYCR